MVKQKRSPLPVRGLVDGLTSPYPSVTLTSVRRGRSFLFLSQTLARFSLRKRTRSGDRPGLQNRRAAGFLSPVGSTPTRFRHFSTSYRRQITRKITRYRFKQIKMRVESVSPSRLFVPQSLNGIKTRGPDGWYHSAHQPNGSEDQCGHDQSAW